MSLATFRNAVTSNIGRQILLTQKHSPKILFATGVVGAVTATVLACRATLKVSAVLDEADKRRLDVNNNATSEDDQTTALRKLQIVTALEIAKLYTPSAVLLAGSIAALTGSHVVLTRRNAGVMAAYAAVDRAYKEYRQRVTNEYGEDIDRKFATGSGDVVVEEKLADGTVKKNVVQGKGEGRYGGSPYAVVFDEFSKKYSREPGRNPSTIAMTQNWANNKLWANGHLFLNEVYDMLGLPRTKAGAVVGWVYRKDNETKTGDNYVDFGVFDGDVEATEKFLDWTHPSIVLDFNVDGVILDLI